jgi:ABC-type multidrug transport system ATPase subunit
MNVAGETISDTSWARRVALAAPWCTPPQHLTLEQALQFHGTFRESRTGQLGWGMLLEASGLKVADNVPMNRWSSGQRQRLNLALAMGTAADVVLLDEPASNLDAQGIAWLHRVLADMQGTSTVVVATNDLQREAPKAPSLLAIEK